VTRRLTFKSVLEKAEALGRLLENILLSVLLTGMIGLGAGQILLRWSGAGSFAWGDEAIRLMVLWIAMIAGIASAREDRHIAIDVLSRFLSSRGKAISAVFVDLFTAIVCLVLAWYGWRMVEYAMEDGDVFFGTLPAWAFQAIIPAAFLLMGYRYLIWFARRLREAAGGAQAVVQAPPS
jgi:TRAP-type C4-dicarboxylate transport system permease small subunit